MENPDIIASDVHVHLDLEKKNDSYDCTFTCKGLMQVPCDRCLDPIDIDADTTYHITVKYGEDYNDETDDLLIIPQSDTYINVAYMLYDTLVLTIPLRHVHPLGKCNRAMPPRSASTVRSAWTTLTRISMTSANRSTLKSRPNDHHPLLFLKTKIITKKL